MRKRKQGDSVRGKVCSHAMPTQSEEPSHYGRISVVSVVEGNLGAGVCEALKECGKCL